MMLSVEMGLNTQNLALAQAPSSPLGPTQQDEEKKKQSHVPTVEVSTAQLQAVSARVGDFLANQPSRSTNVSGSSSDSVLPTGADGALPVAAPVGETQPASPTEDGGTSTDGEPNEASIAMSLLAAEQGEETSKEEPVSRQPNEYDSLSNSDDDDDLTYSASLEAAPPLSELPPASPVVVGTLVDIAPRPEPQEIEQDELSGFDEERGGQDSEQNEVEQQEETARSSAPANSNPSPNLTQVSNGGFSLVFDEAGTYQFAAA